MITAQIQLTLLMLGPRDDGLRAAMFDRVDILIARAVESSRPTKTPPGCRLRLFEVVLAGCSTADERGGPRSAGLSITVRELHALDRSCRIAEGSFARGAPEIRGSGYVVRSLEAALWGVPQALDFLRLPAG